MNLCKVCSEKEPDKFYPTYKSMCIACVKAKTKKYRKDPSHSKAAKERAIQWAKDNPEQFKERQKRHRQTLKGRFGRAKSAAKKRGKDFSISLEEFSTLFEFPCYYCSNILAPKTKTLAGLDRIDNAEGYCYTNVVPCCSTCNRIRGDELTQEETLAAIRAILAVRHPDSNPNNQT